MYARTSRTDQDAAMQISELRALAEHRRWQVCGEFIDQTSGARASRPALTQVEDLVRRGRVDLVAVWRLDRLGRSLKNFLTIVDEFEANRVQLVSVREGIDMSTPMGRMFARLLAVFAEMEREWIIERTRAGLDEARRRGVRLGRRPTRIDLDHALQLRAEGWTIRSVAQELGVARSVVHRAVKRAPGGLCAVCRAPVLLDMHGRAHWHPALGEGAAVCSGAGHDVDPLEAVPESSSDEAPESR